MCGEKTPPPILFKKRELGGVFTEAWLGSCGDVKSPHRKTHVSTAQRPAGHAGKAAARPPAPAPVGDAVRTDAGRPWVQAAGELTSRTAHGISPQPQQTPEPLGAATLRDWAGAETVQFQLGGAGT